MLRTARGTTHPRSPLFVALTCAALTLSACGSITPDWLGSEEEAAAQPAASAQVPAATGDSEAAGSEAGGEPGQVVEIISPGDAPPGQPPAPSQEAAQPQAETLAALPPEPAFNDDPQQLIGMGPASLNAFLGAPELIRREAPASLWQYRAEDCVLDVVLYPDLSGDKVTYLEAREDGATKIAPRTCLNKLLRARYGDTAG